MYVYYLVNGTSDHFQALWDFGSIILYSTSGSYTILNAKDWQPAIGSMSGSAVKLRILTLTNTVSPSTVRRDETSASIQDTIITNITAP